MHSDKQKQQCLQARPYYYDFLAKGNDSHIPEDVLQHIARCSHCKSEIHRLKSILETKEQNLQSEQRKRFYRLSDMLNLHFSHLDNLVKCKDAKPFLPLMIISRLGIKIPTPVTAHIDNCSSCAEDIETLRKMDLKEDQLIRLAHFLAQKPDKKSSTAKNTILSTKY